MNFTLKELVEYKAQAESRLTEDASDDVQELALVADALLKGKVDQAARFKAGLEKHIEDAKKALEGLELMLERTEALMREAVLLAPDLRLEGETYTFRMQKNSRASLLIDDEALLPDSFRRASVSITFPFEEREAQFWAGAVLKRPVEIASGEGDFFSRLSVSEEEREALKRAIVLSLDRRAVEAAVKESPEKFAPNAVLERGSHLRIDAGKKKQRLLAEVG